MKENSDIQTLIEAIKVRRWQNTSRTILDVLEPIAPLVSQLLWVVQPISNVIGARDVVSDLAETLDSPEGIEHLRNQLDKK